MITLNKIKLIREKTLVDFKTAENTLKECDGNVNNAISKISFNFIEKAIINHKKKGK
jgi:NACalpha-BTF3-like transcription factor